MYTKELKGSGEKKEKWVKKKKRKIRMIGDLATANEVYPKAVGFMP